MRVRLFSKFNTIEHFIFYYVYIYVYLSWRFFTRFTMLANPKHRLSKNNSEANEGFAMKLKFNKKTEYFQEHINTFKFFSKYHRRERVMAGEKRL